MSSINQINDSLKMNPGGQRSLFMMGGGTMSVPSSSHMLMTHPPMMTQALGGVRLSQTNKFPIKQDPMESLATPTANLYLCSTGNSTIIKQEIEERQEKTSVDLLDQAYQSLIQKKIKDSLSSFIASVPGEFDNRDTHESMLRSLIDRPPIGGREFLPISEQNLQGFRLQPGRPLPEQYQLDPSSLEVTKHHKKKKKHKHKHATDKNEESSLDNYSPIRSREHSPPTDPCEFIKQEHTSNFFVPPPHPTPAYQAPPLTQPTQHHPPTIIHSSAIPAVVVAGNLIPTNFNPSPQSVIVGGAAKFSTSHTHPSIPGFPVLLGPGMHNKPKKQKRHENGEGGPPKKKKKKDKEKRKKKEKHHNLDQAPPPPPPPAPSSGSSSSLSGPPTLIHPFIRPS